MPHLDKNLCEDLLNQRLSIAQSSDLALQLAFNRPVCLLEKCKFVQSTIDCFSLLGSESSCINSSIGRYCTIGSKVQIGSMEQDPSQTALSPVFHGNVFSFAGFTGPQTSPYIEKVSSAPVQCTDQSYSRIQIGHDVWIGELAILAKSVKVGHGAIIRQGASISQDVQPYSIVSSTNIVVGQRYPDEVISDLLELEWWNYDLPEMLHQGQKIPLDDIHGFIDYFKNADPQMLIKAPNDWVRTEVTETDFITKLDLIKCNGEVQLDKI